MAVVSDRKQTFLREIEALNHQKRQLLEQVTTLRTNDCVTITNGFLQTVPDKASKSLTGFVSVSYTRETHTDPASCIKSVHKLLTSCVRLFQVLQSSLKQAVKNL